MAFLVIWLIMWLFTLIITAHQFRKQWGYFVIYVFLCLPFWWAFLGMYLSRDKEDWLD